MNGKLNQQQKDKWLSVITNDTMSSEESGPDDTIIVHSLPWRTQYVSKMFEKIDQYTLSKKSSQAVRQMKSRTIGVVSSRPAPTAGKFPQWAIKA